jgi:hypothetical protein
MTKSYGHSTPHGGGCLNMFLVLITLAGLLGWMVMA